MSATCRYYHPTDRMSLHGLMMELGYTVPLEELEENIKSIHSRGGAVFVAEINHEVVGSICSVIDARLAEGVYAEIVSLVVSSAHRGKGIGKQLVNQAETWSRKHAKKIRVRANVKRDQAHGFYTALGFEETKVQKVFIKHL